MRWLARHPRAVFLACFAVSGAAGLVNQVIWTRWLGLLTGNFATATALVLGVFMAGLGLGNEWAGRRSGRLEAVAALRGYAVLEALLAAFSLAATWMFPAAAHGHAALAALLPHRLAVTALCLILLLPPTILMGATLPLIVHGYRGGGGSLAALYGLNTLGAAAGPLLAAFVLLPPLGLRGTGWIAALLNALAAGGAWFAANRMPEESRNSPDSTVSDPDPSITGRHPPAAGAANPEPADGLPPPHEAGSGLPVPPLPPLTSSSSSPASPNPFPSLLLFAFLSGLLSLGFELVLARLLILTVTGGSVYGLAINLSAFLAGMGLGALVHARRPPRDPAAARRGFAIALALAWAFSLMRPLWDRLPLLLLDVWLLPLPQTTLLGIRFLLAFGIVGAVAGAFGYALPALAAGTRGDPARTGRLFALNTLGAVAGTALTGFWLLPAFGLDRAFAGLGAAALLTAATALAPALRPGRRPVLLAGALAASAAGFLLPGTDPARMNSATLFRPHRFASSNSARRPEEIVSAMGVIVSEEDSPTGRVAIRKSGTNVALIVNGKPDASTTARDAVTMVLIAHLPLVMHPDPRTGLVVGLGGGLTLSSMLSHPVSRVDCVEISPATVRAARWFSVWTGLALDDPRTRIIQDDARHVLAVTDRTWDVIISEPSNLYVAGTVHLFTREYYELARRRLAPGGLFIQWTHYYGMADGDLRTVVRTVAGTFPHLLVFVQPGGDFFVMGSDGPLPLDLSRGRARFARPDVRTNLGRIEIASAEALLGHALWDRDDALRWTGAGPVCTDDRPVLEFSSPLTPDRPEITDANRRLFLSFGPLRPLPLADPTGPDRLALAREHERIGALERAAAELREAVRLAPRLREAWWRLGRIESWLGRTDDARQTLRTGLAKAGAYAPATRLLAELGSGAPKPPAGLQPAGRSP